MRYERYSDIRTKTYLYGCHPQQGHEAGDGCASLAVGAWIPLSAESSTIARKT